MKLIFKLGLLLRLELWNRHRDLDDSMFIEMNDDGLSFGIKPEGDNSFFVATIYNGDFITADQLRELAETIKKTRKIL